MHIHKSQQSRIEPLHHGDCIESRDATLCIVWPVMEFIRVRCGRNERTNQTCYLSFLRSRLSFHARKQHCETEENEGRREIREVYPNAVLDMHSVNIFFVDYYATRLLEGVGNTTQ